MTGAALTWTGLPPRCVSAGHCSALPATAGRRPSAVLSDGFVSNCPARLVHCSQGRREFHAIPDELVSYRLGLHAWFVELCAQCLAHRADLLWTRAWCSTERPRCSASHPFRHWSRGCITCECRTATRAACRSTTPRSPISVFAGLRREYLHRWLGSDRRCESADRGLTTRWLDAGTGFERLSLSAAQRIYFADQKVILPGETPRKNVRSDFLVAASAALTDTLSTDVAAQYNPMTANGRAP